MSRAQREAGIAMAIWADELRSLTIAEIEAEALRRYPDSPEPQTVRDILIQWLKENGYDGLYSKGWGCTCSIENLGCLHEHRACQYMLECVPGVLVDGKIVERDK